MPTVGDVVRWMDTIAPPELSESWDNTGLLLGDRSNSLQCLMTCLTLSEDVADEAISGNASMVITHHPLPFKPLSTVTTDTTTGKIVWELCRAGVAVYSPHTAWDSCETGINAQLAEAIGLGSTAPLLPSESNLGAGTGRVGDLATPQNLAQVAKRLGSLPGFRPRGVEPGAKGSESEFRRVAIGCGSAGGLLPAAAENGAELFVTGEATYHTCLEAKALGMGLLLLGHFASEAFAMVRLAETLSQTFPDVEVWSSKNEFDPVRNL